MNFLPRLKKALPILSLVFLFSALTATVYVVQKNTFNKGRAAEPKKTLDSISLKRKIAGFNEQKGSFSVDVKSQININSILKKSDRTDFLPLPTTGEWHGSSVQIVPNDRFFPEYDYFTHYGYGAVVPAGLKDGRIIVGGFEAFAIKDPSDAEWMFLQLIVIPQEFGFYTPKRIVETNANNPDVYFTGDSSTFLMASDGNLIEVPDPNNISGHLQYIKDIAPYGENGMVGFTDGPVGWPQGSIVYMEGGQMRSWLTPKPFPDRNSDKILGIFNDPYHGDNTTFFAFYAPASGGVFLYQFHFSIDPDVPLEVIELGSITGEVNNPHFIKLRQRKDDPSKTILYAAATTNPAYNIISTSFLTIEDFDPNADQNTAITTYFPTYYYPNGEFEDFTIQNRDGGDAVFVSSGSFDFTGMMYGWGFDNGGPIITEHMTETERDTLLANGFTNYITTDAFNNIIVSHWYFENRYNNGLITIIGPGQNLTPTPTPIPNSNPVITTSRLAQGQVGQSYQEFIRGNDSNVEDILTMNISGLPAGLKAGKCVQKPESDRKEIACSIIGRPNQAGNYQINVNLTDNQGGSDQKILKLKITP